MSSIVSECPAMLAPVIVENAMSSPGDRTGHELEASERSGEIAARSVGPANERTCGEPFEESRVGDSAEARLGDISACERVVGDVGAGDQRLRRDSGATERDE